VDSLINELSKDWFKIDKLKILSELLMNLREMGHRVDRYLKQPGLRDGSMGNKKEGKKSEGGKKGKKFKKEAGGSSKGKGKDKDDFVCKDKAVELKRIPKALLDERGQREKWLKSGKDGHNWYESWCKQPVIGKVAENKRKTREGPKEEGGRAPKKSKP